MRNTAGSGSWWPMPPRPSRSDGPQERSSSCGFGSSVASSYPPGQCTHFDEAFPRLLRLSRALHHVIRKAGRGHPTFIENRMAASMGAATEKENFEMKKLCLSLVLGIVAFGVGAARAQAQGAAAAPQIPMSKPPVTYGYDIRPQVLLDLDQLQQKFVPLAEAIPAEKYTWRSEEGARSIAEVFLHITAANYNIPELIGGEVPAKYKAKDWEKSTTDKATIVAELKQSFANAIAVVTKVPTSDIAAPLPKLGPDANKGDVEYLLVTHAHEHLGQSIAYARSVGVTPPWTVAAEAAAKKKAAEGKPEGQKPE
jgi:uncharacterized damage-inducible protein DinB